MVSEAVVARTADAGIRLEARGRSGRILLDRPRSMNALDLAMVKAFRDALEELAARDDVTSVVVASTREGVFCAGGDVRAIRQLRLDGEHAQADAFFEHEFALNQRIATFPKPYVALIDGLCLGGGMGLSVHGSHPVAGPRASLGMPETAIGYFPDVGGSFFLNRLPRHWGRFFGLTGIRAEPADAVGVGFVRAALDDRGLSDLQAALADGAHPDDVLRGSAQAVEAGRLLASEEFIKRCFDLDSPTAIMIALRREDDLLAAEALNALETGSPASLAMTLDLLERAKDMTLGECLELEYRYACEVTRGAEFSEGVRAMLVDKDRKPDWPSRVAL